MGQHSRSTTGQSSNEWAEIFLSGLLKLAAMFNRQMDELLTETYREGLSDLDIDMLRSVYRRALLECKFMPTVAELRGFLHVDRLQINDNEGEAEWTRILAHCEKWGRAVWPSDPKLVLSAAGEHAFRSVGCRDGILNTLESAPEFIGKMKKEFIQTYAHFVSSGGLKLTQAETRGMIAEIAAESRKMLTEPRTVPPSPPVDPGEAKPTDMADSAEIARTLRQVIPTGKPYIVNNDSEEQRRRIAEDVEKARQIEKDRRIS